MPDEAPPTLKLKPERILEVVRGGCRIRAECRVDVQGEDGVVRKSRLLYTDRNDKGERVLLIEGSTTRPPTKGTPLVVRYDYEGQSLILSSAYRDFTFYKGPDGKPFESWRIEFPEEISALQRRSHFRVRADLGETMQMHIVVIPKPTNKMDGVEAGKERESARPVAKLPVPSSPVMGMMWDISGGGLSFTLYPEHHDKVARGNDILMTFALPGVRGRITLRGKVVFIKDEPEAEAGKLFCIEFTDPDMTVESRQSMNHIRQFIAMREREIIAQIRGGRRAE